MKINHNFYALSRSMIAFLVTGLAITACNKVKSPSVLPGFVHTAHFYTNSFWSGTSHASGRQYDEPCAIRFSGDTALTVYSFFSFFISNTVVDQDSLKGKITKIDSLPDGTINLQISYPYTGDQQSLQITNQKFLKLSSALTSQNGFSPNLQFCPKPIPSVSGPWSSKIAPAGIITDGQYLYPDLATFSFNSNKSMTYYRNKKIVSYTPSDHIQALLITYQQYGPVVYFAGYDEISDNLLAYFGVLSPDGSFLWVDSRAVDSRGVATYRLPNYVLVNAQGEYYYGPPGATPVIYRQ